MSKKIRLSQCMIVKNEEKNITRALSWGKDIMWEQIVVDTGSTDRTVELAQAMGAKIYHFDWIDDFAAAKNYAIEQASGDWIVMLDADEYFLPEDTKKLLPILKQLHNSQYHAVVTGCIQVGEDENVMENATQGKLRWVSAIKADGSKRLALSGIQIRIFRNQPTLRFRRRIHEQLFCQNKPLLFADASNDLSFLHTGYAEASLNEQKVHRNMKLIRQELEETPNDYTMLACMGDSYSELNIPEEAVHWYEQALCHIPSESASSGSAKISMIYKKLLTLYLTQLSDENAALHVYDKAVLMFPADADYDYLLGRIYASQKQWQKAAFHLQKALELLETHNSSDSSVMLVHNLVDAYELLAESYYETGDLPRCVNCSVAILKADPGRRGTLEKLLLAFLTDEKQSASAASPAQVKVFLENFYHFEKAEDTAFVLETAKSVGYDGLAQALRDET